MSKTTAAAAPAETTEITVDQVITQAAAALDHSKNITTSLAESIKNYDLDKLIARTTSLSTRILAAESGSREITRLTKKLTAYQAELATRIA